MGEYKRRNKGGKKQQIVGADVESNASLGIDLVFLDEDLGDPIAFSSGKFTADRIIRGVYYSPRVTLLRI